MQSIFQLEEDTLRNKAPPLIKKFNMNDNAE